MFSLKAAEMSKNQSEETAHQIGARLAEVQAQRYVCYKCRVILRFFQRIYLIEFAENVSKERQYKGYCLISNES